eukprot:tig00000605_g2497.t1
MARHIAVFVLLACWLAAASAQNCFEKTQVQIVSPSTDFKQNLVCVVGQNCTITWQAATRCDRMTFDIGTYHWFQPASVQDDGVHSASINTIVSGLSCSSRLTPSMYPTMSTCSYTWIPTPESMTSESMGFVTLVVTAKFGTSTLVIPRQVYGYMIFAGRVPQFQSPSNFAQTFLPVLNGQLAITSSNSSVKHILEQFWGSATTFDLPEFWTTGEQRSVSFSIGYPIVTSPISARFYDLHGFFQRLRAANGSSILSIIDKLAVDATISEGKQFDFDPASRPAIDDNPDQQAPPSNGTFDFVVPAMLPGSNEYWLTLRAIDIDTPSAAMLRAEVTTPVTPKGSNVIYAAPGVGYSGWTDPTNANLSSPVAECTKAPDQYNVTLNFTAGPAAGSASSVMLTLSVGSAVNYTCMLESFEGSLVKCVADDRAGERERNADHLPVCMRAEFQDRFQYAMKLTFTNAEGSCTAPVAKPACSAASARRPAILRDQSLLGRMVPETNVNSTFTATATLIRIGATPLPTPTPSPTPSATPTPSAIPAPTPVPSLVQRVESLPGPSIFGIVLCVLFGIGWVAAGFYHFYLKYFKTPFEAQRNVLPR